MANDRMNHIDPADLSDLLAGQKDQAKEREIRQHLRVCGICQAELALARSFHEQATEGSLAPEILARLEAGLAASRPRSIGWRPLSRQRTWIGAGLLAASLVCVLLGINALREPSIRQGHSGAMRATPVAAEWDLSLSQPESGSVQIAWPAVGEASQYEIRLQSVTGEALWSSRVEKSPFALTFSELPEAVRSERFLYVSLVALVADSTQQATRPHLLPARP